MWLWNLMMLCLTHFFSSLSPLVLLSSPLSIPYLFLDSLKSFVYIFPCSPLFPFSIEIECINFSPNERALETFHVSDNWWGCRTFCMKALLLLPVLVSRVRSFHVPNPRDFVFHCISPRMPISTPGEDHELGVKIRAPPHKTKQKEKTKQSKNKTQGKLWQSTGTCFTKPWIVSAFLLQCQKQMVSVLIAAINARMYIFSRVSGLKCKTCVIETRIWYKCKYWQVHVMKLLIVFIPPHENREFGF